jgi:WD40 repeat protein
MTIERIAPPSEVNPPGETKGTPAEALQAPFGDGLTPPAIAAPTIKPVPLRREARTPWRLSLRMALLVPATVGLLLFTVGWLVVCPTAIPGDELPNDAAKRIKEFEAEVEAIHKKGEAEIQARRNKFIEDLEALKVAYTKAGKLDEAVAIRDRIGELKAECAEDCAIEIRRLEGHTNVVQMVTFSPDGQTLASASDDGTVRLWDWKTGKQHAPLQGHAGGVLYANFCPDGKTLATGSRDKSVIFWDPLKQQKRARRDDHSGDVNAVLYSPDGKTFATASSDTLVFVREPKGKVQRILKGHTMGVVALAYSPNGKTLVSAAGDWNNPGRPGEVKAWNLENGENLWAAAGQFPAIWGVAFAPDGKSVAGACIDASVRIWEAATGKERKILKGHTDRLFSVAYTPSGKTLASSGHDAAVRLWDAASGKEKAVLRGHAGPVLRLCFSPDGRILATAGVDRTIRLWQLGRLDERTGMFGR